MVTLDTLALMREATRLMQATITGTMLVQVTAGETAEIPDAYIYWYVNLMGNDPHVLTATIEYNAGTWGPIKTYPSPILGAVQNDLLRIELSVTDAVDAIRNSGYTGPLVFGGLLQPVSHPIPPNPLYNFSPSTTSSEYYFVDAVTGTVTHQG